MITIYRNNKRVSRAAMTLVLACAALFPLASHALGLGRLKVHSSLNEPLNAEIEFTSITEAELKRLNVGLAARADFEAAGVERAAFLSQIAFTVAKRADGKYSLRLTTTQQIEEPFLHLLLQVEWTGGRLVREYTALIDPPYQVASRAPGVRPPTAAPKKEEPAAPKAEPAPVETPAKAPLAPAGTATAEETPPGPAAAPSVAASPDTGQPVEAEEAAPKAAAAVKTAAPTWATASRYTVKPGDTLWSITKKLRADARVSIEQAALAIYKRNKNAFFGSNVNNIRAGKILRMPAREVVEAVTRERAHKEFQAQFDVWQEYKMKLASAGRTLKVSEEAEAAPAAQKPTAPKKEEAVAKAPAAEEKARPADELLKIVRANIQSEKVAGMGTEAEPAARTEAKEQQALAERAATLEESLASRQLEHKEMSEKIGQVRAQLKREARLIEIESQTPVRAPEQKPAEAPKPPETGPEAKPVPPAPEAAKPEEKSAPEPAAPPAKSAEAPKPSAGKKPLPPPPLPREEKGFLATLLDALGDLLMPLLLGIVAVASAAIVLVYLRRRRKSVAEFEESILATHTPTTETMAARAATSGQAAVTAEPSVLSDISQGGLARIHTDEVDPVAEAEVYLAYGRDETAEEILKDAIVKHPQRHELKLKLLEVYSGRKDVRSFETLAEELYAALGGAGGKLWERVVEMGQKLSPENPMFRGGAAKRGEPAAAVAAVVSPPAPAAEAPVPEMILDFDLGTPAVTTQATEASGSIDFDVGASGPTKAKTKVEEFDIDMKPATEPAKPAAPAAGIEALDLGAPVDNLVDFDFDKLAGTTGGATTARPVEAAPAQVAAAATDSITWDLGALAGEPAPAATPPVAETAAAPTGAGQQQQWDEAATKLDLARAYIDMGDADGARSILDEVMAEGNPEQKKQAQELVAQIR